MKGGRDCSVFTTALVQKGKIKWLDEHLFRLAKHALALGISHPGDAVLRAELSRVELDESPQLLRIALSQDGHEVTTRAISTLCSEPLLGAKLLITNIEVDPQFAKLKSNQRAPYDEARKCAEQEGAFEALLVDEDGYVVDGVRSSPLLFHNDALISLEGGLQGITREKVLAKATALGIHCSRMRLRSDELKGQLLVAGSGVGLMPDTPVTDPRVAALIDVFRIIQKG